MPSAAVQQLNAVNDKDKGMKSRLRRAFSFGSAAELRRASAENNISAERAKLRKDRYQSEEDAEQAAIIAKQEAAGIGAGIYSGQGGMGSTDNLSVASAASSASIMLRKMGHGMKKGSRSIKGLFRPKSVIGVPAADGPITRPSVGEVSLVTVEAERQKVNVNADPHEQARGGTGYPKLERNSIDAGRSAEFVNPGNLSNDTMSRKSIVGNDRERAEVLSNIKKGILKRKLQVVIRSTFTNMSKVTAPLLTQDHQSSAQQTRLPVSGQTPPAHPTRRARFAMTTTSQNPVFPTAAQEVFQALLKAARATSRSAHASNFMTHGHPRTTIDEETLPHATDLRLC
jgi:hypothetical protein